MSNKDFLQRMKKAGEEFSSGGAGIIGRIKVEFGFHGYIEGPEYNFWSFWKPVGDEGDMMRVSEELTGRMQAAGSTERPNFGLKVTVDKNVLSAPQPYKGDLQEFVSAWQEDGYSMLCDAIENADIPIGEWFWGQVQYKANPYFVKMGEAGKKDEDQNGNKRFPTIRVPVAKFTSKEAAQEQVGSSTESSTSTGGWSATAIKNYGPDMTSLEKQANEILDWLEKAQNSTAFNNDAEGYPLPVPFTPPNIKKYIADIYSIESSDIDMLIPF